MQLIVPSREVFESEQRTEKHTLETPKERDKERERKKKASHVLGNMYYLGMKERQRLVHVLDFVNSHTPVVGLGQSLAGNDLQ